MTRQRFAVTSNYRLKKHLGFGINPSKMNKTEHQEYLVRHQRRLYLVIHNQVLSQAEHLDETGK